MTIISILFFSILGLGFITLMSLLILVSRLVATANYKKTNTLLKKLALLLDPNGYLTPTFVAYIALRANDLEHAHKIIDNLDSESSQRAIYLLRTALAALENDWDRASTQFDALAAAMRADGRSTAPLEPLATAIAVKDAVAFLEAFKIKGFGRMEPRLATSSSES